VTLSEAALDELPKGFRKAMAQICVLSTRGIDETADHWGGVNTHTKMLSRLLAGEGHQVSLITARSDWSRECKTLDGIQVIQIPGAKGGRVDREWADHSRKALLELHQKSPADHIFSEGDASKAVSKIARRLKIPVTAFVHNFPLVHIYNTWQEVIGLRSFFPYTLKTLPRLLFQIGAHDIPFFRSCDRVVTGSRYNERLIQRFYRVPRAKLGTLHNWVDTDVFVPDDALRKECRGELGISGSQLVILYLGSVWRPKGVSVAIRAFNQLALDFPEAIFIIVGEGPEVAALQRLASQLPNTKGRIRFLGLWPHPHLPSIYNAADILLMPSFLLEVLPYSLIEAMACQLPVIASRRAGCMEAVGDAGVLVEPGNVEDFGRALKTLVSEPQKRRTLSEMARKRVIECFSLKVARKRIISILETQ